MDNSFCNDKRNEQKTVSFRVKNFLLLGQLNSLSWVPAPVDKRKQDILLGNLSG